MFKCRKIKEAQLIKKMANDKKVKNSLAKQVKKMVYTRRSSSSSENEMSVVQLKKKIKQLKNIKHETEEPSREYKRKSQLLNDSPPNQSPSTSASKFQKKLNNYEGPSNSYKKPTNTNLDVEEVEEEVNGEANTNNTQLYYSDQLYGSFYDADTMVHIGNEIYCRSTILNMALGSSHKATHVARKLIEGVFHLESILVSTLSGLPARAQGKERQNLKVKMMDFRARRAIIDFALTTANNNNWTLQTTTQIERAMSQRIGELKRSANKI